MTGFLRITKLDLFTMKSQLVMYPKIPLNYTQVIR